MPDHNLLLQSINLIALFSDCAAVDTDKSQKRRKHLHTLNITIYFLSIRIFTQKFNTVQ